MEKEYLKVQKLNKYNNLFYKLYKISQNLLFFVIFFCFINFQKSLSFLSLFETGTPNMISIIIYLLMTRFRINPSNTLLFFIGLTHDIISGNNIGITSIFLLLLKFFFNSIFFEKIIKNKKEEWMSFTIIFIFSFSIVFLLNMIINLSVPDLSPIFFHVCITLILFPIINIGISFFIFVTQLIKS